MTMLAIVFVLALSLWLGLLALVVQLQWRSLYPTLRYLYFIPFGLAVALCTPGPVLLGEVLVCWPITSCWSA